MAQQKTRPRTAKTKNEEDNVFYRRQIGGSNPVYTSTQRGDPAHNSRTNLQDNEAGETPGAGEIGVRNERISKTIAEEEHQKRNVKRHRTMGADGEEEGKEEGGDNANHQNNIN
jgi:hypothetical protein